MSEENFPFHIVTKRMYKTKQCAFRIFRSYYYDDDDPLKYLDGDDDDDSALGNIFVYQR